MRVEPIRALVVVTVLLLAAGCGGGSEHVAASTVTMTQTGGIAGVHEVRTVRSEGAPPARLTDADRDRLFRLVSGDDFRDLDRSYVPSGYCCDRFHYGVAVRYEDGSTRRTATADGVDAPDVLRNVLRLVGKVEPS